ncbi:MAG: HAD family phosphatase [Phycisphaeraceae bacterium]|nr:HAD family phosphatase [Phycisphaeraceae bacterium]
MSTPYRLLALDLDGTLLDPSGNVSRANVEAVRAARHAGITVLVCTGRGLVECRHVLDRIEQDDPVVIAGGSMLACPRTSSTLHRFPMERDLVRAAVDHITGDGHAALVLKDRHAAGYDYFVITPDGASLDPVTRWWFEALGVAVRHATSLDEDEHPEHTVRVGLCAPGHRSAAAAARIREAFRDRAVLHYFPAVMPGSDITDPAEVALILELFDPRVSKWTAISWFAAQRGIPLGSIAAIGDQVNDIPMIAHAALGIAMGNAIEEVKSAAKRHTLPNTRDGVAHAIGEILAGRW